MKLLFFLTFSLFSQKLEFVTAPNGIKVYEDQNLKNKQFIPYKDSFERIHDPMLEGFDKIIYKEKKFYLKVPLNIPHHNATRGEDNDYNKEAQYNFLNVLSFLKSDSSIYSKNKIQLYKKPFLDEKADKFLESWKSYQVSSSLSNYSKNHWYCLKLENQFYYFQDYEIESYYTKESAEKFLNLKAFGYKETLLDILEPRISFVYKNGELVQETKIPNGVYSLEKEVLFKEKKYYQIDGANIKGEVYILSENLKKFSFNEFSDYTLAKSKWKENSFLKNISHEKIKDEFGNEENEFIDFRTLKLDQISLGKKIKLIILNYYGKTSSEKIRLYFLKKDKIISIAYILENQLLIHDFDKDKIPEIVLQDIVGRGSNRTRFIKTGKDDNLYNFYMYNGDFSVENNKLVLIETNGGTRIDKVVIKFENGNYYYTNDNKKFKKVKWFRLKI